MTSALELTPNASYSATDSIIRVHQLHKHYGRIAAVRGIDFSVAPGELFGLIGPDGAGKTTTFHILSGIMEATAGEVQVLGLPARDARLQIGYLTQQFSLYLDLSINENLQYVAGLREVPEPLFQERRAKYLKLMSLDQFGDRLAGQLSGGMKQKLALCGALVSQPKVLLLDEPTTGVDPVSRREFWDVLAALTAEGVTIVVATPYLDEAERCNRVALMYDGIIQQIGTPAQLRHGLGLHRIEVHTPQLEIAEQALSESAAITDVQTFGDRLDVLAADPDAGEREIRSRFRDQHLSLTSLRAAEPTLENVFVTRLRQQGSAPQILEFPRGRSSRKSSEDVAIYARNLNRVFGIFQAVKNVDVEVRYGEIFGLLGANGAGKTTTIKMLCGLLPASSGEIALGGERGNLRSSDLRKRIGYMSQKFTLYDDLSIVQNLQFYSGVYGVPRKLRREKIDWVLATCGLEGQENMLTGQLPGGWKQRVAFGASVLHEPDILFLDEPTSGVDPLARRQFWRLINDFARNGTAILVTTHYLEEAEQCNRMSFMVAGETVLEGSPSQIKAAQPGQLIEVVLNQTQAASNLLKQQMESWRVSIFADRLHVVIDHPEEIEQLRSRLIAANLSPISLLPIPYSLEDAFIGVVQRAQL
ncbi:ATP-binding cassette domain-containing protein [Leptolyngbya sp. FACHB-17]|uniref:ATP-binding cassette domain-containing protein n=1 Tax=unclassified Leptolyngbya TaxID=2650499 RepID=UPI00167FF401|nr:ATP-binding cassette domain-containing protein [Leptolyngbya sp. FACHB-17]MBD2081320.1 ABC transporter ATP-binding protein [Leptolyngbya sp. FACHB-17]